MRNQLPPSCRRQRLHFAGLRYRLRVGGLIRIGLGGRRIAMVRQVRDHFVALLPHSRCSNRKLIISALTSGRTACGPRMESIIRFGAAIWLQMA